MAAARAMHPCRGELGGRFRAKNRRWGLIERLRLLKVLKGITNRLPAWKAAKGESRACEDIAALRPPDGAPGLRILVWLKEGPLKKEKRRSQREVQGKKTRR